MKEVFGLRMNNDRIERKFKDKKGKTQQKFTKIIINQFYSDKFKWNKKYLIFFIKVLTNEKETDIIKTTKTKTAKKKNINNVLKI